MIVNIFLGSGFYFMLFLFWGIVIYVLWLIYLICFYNFFKLEDKKDIINK